MPPTTPPARLVRVRIRPSSSRYSSSLWVEPRSRVPAKPEPSSKPFTAGIESMALARSASSLSNTGAPQPAGTPRIDARMTPPTESPSLRARPRSPSPSPRRRRDRGSAPRWRSTSARVTVSPSTAAAIVLDLVDPGHEVIPSGATIASATAPAATRPTVSRALARPPPAIARMPNLAS
jgi:hypothetical protein